MKTIVVKWIPQEDWGYDKVMKVIYSDHSRFVEGSRFDFGYFQIATTEGFTIISIPMDENEEER